MPKRMHSDGFHSGSESEGSSKAPYKADYRQHVLPLNGVRMEGSKLYGEVLPAPLASQVRPLMDAIARTYSLPPEASWEEIKQRLEEPPDELRNPLPYVQNIISRVTWYNFWAYEETFSSLGGDPNLGTTKKRRWTTRLQPLNEEQSSFSAKSLFFSTGPTPDFALGLKWKITPSRYFAAEVQTGAPFSSFFKEHKQVNARALLILEEHSDTRLHPRPDANGDLVYPCLVRMGKGQLESIYVAANQLAKSITYALDQQEELRLLAGAPVEERMPVFGIASSGSEIQLWCGAYVESEICMVSLRRPLQLDWLAHACAFANFMEILHSWLLSTYAPRIIAWLDILWVKTRPGATAKGTEGMELMEVPESSK